MRLLFTTIRVLASLAFLLEQSSVVASCGTAICFSGHFRTFSSSESLRESIKTNLVDALGANAEIGCGSDVFAYLSQSEAVNEAVSIAEFIRIFKPIRFVVAPPDEALDINASRHTSVNLPPLPTEQEINRQPSWVWADNPAAVVGLARLQYRKIMKCYELVLDHEVHHGRYAWVVRARFDGGWYRPLPPASTFRRDRVWLKNTVYNGIQDQFFLVPRHLSDAAFGAAAWLFDSEAPRWWSSGLLWQPESFLWKAWREVGVPFGRATVPFVLVRDQVGPECYRNLPWSSLILLLDNIIYRDKAPERTHLSEALRRSETAACVGNFGNAPMGHVVNLKVTHDAIADQFFINMSASPTLNTHELLTFCDEKGIAGDVSCNVLIEQLWYKGIPIDLPSKEHSAEQEYQWMVRELMALSQVSETNSNLSYVYEVMIDEHRDPSLRALQPPSSLRLCVSPKLIASVARAALCVYLSNYGLLLSISATAPEWSNASELGTCLEMLHEAEQDIEALFDAHNYTNPSWGGDRVLGNVLFQGRKWVDGHLDKVESQAIVRC